MTLRPINSSMSEQIKTKVRNTLLQTKTFLQNQGITKVVVHQKTENMKQNYRQLYLRYLKIVWNQNNLSKSKKNKRYLECKHSLQANLDSRGKRLVEQKN